MADIYVSALATGGGTGTEVSPYTLSEAIADLNLGAGSTVSQGETVWVKNDGVYQITASLNVTEFPDGAANSNEVLNIKFVGYNNTPGDYSPASHTKVIVQATDAIQMVVFTAAQSYEFWYFCFDGNALATHGINSQVHLYYFEVKNCTTVGVRSNSYSSFGRIHHCHRGSESCTTYGVMHDHNTEWGMYTGTHHFGICAYNANGSYLSTLHNVIIDHNENNSFQTQWALLCSNVIVSNQGPGTNAAVSFIWGRVGRAHYFNFNFFNNAGDDCSAINAITNPTYLDPQFADPANLDYRIVGDNLKNKGLLWINGIDYGLNIGVDQEIPTYASAADVRLGTDRGDGTTGTLDLPSVNDVEEGVIFDNTNKTGVFVRPAEINVKNGITYGAFAEFTGSYDEDYPSVNNVIAGVIYGNLSYEGTSELPIETDVKSGVSYGAGGTEFTGVYDEDYPLENDVRLGISFGNSIYEGTLLLPSTPDVLHSVQYGANGTEYTGLYLPDYPGVSNVRTGVVYAESTMIGTLDIPSVSDVRFGVLYGAGGTEYTGILDLPSESNVRFGTQFDNLKVGNLVLPEQTNVREDILYGANGNEYVGQLVPGYPFIGDINLNLNMDAINVSVEIK